ncbi:MAG TPA: type II toxin-antitoxin system VapB family antitoxin [Candidatus Baltobacteraceae bacterium]|nr:type II toxin-antitoxin system VapB family antitoxin [Candidatus Baltobacteraceae bacterium]
MHVRTALIVDSELIARARALTGIQEKTALVREGLNALIARETARRLHGLGGSDPTVPEVPRRRLPRKHS